MEFRRVNPKLKLEKARKLIIFRIVLQECVTLLPIAIIRRLISVLNVEWVCKC